MSRIDWQAYEDGSLDAATRAQADALLATDPGAQKELEGLRRLKAALRSTAGHEDVPVASLQASLSRTVKSRPKPKRRWLVPALLGAAALAAAFFVFRSLPPRIQFDDSPMVSSTRTSDPSEALRIARAGRGANYGSLDPRPVANLTGVAYGKTWTKFELEYEGKPVSLYLHEHPGKLVNLPALNWSQRLVWIVRDPANPGLAWYAQGCEFLLSGEGGAEAMGPLAGHLIPQTETWPKIKCDPPAD